MEMRLHAAVLRETQRMDAVIDQRKTQNALAEGIHLQAE